MDTIHAIIQMDCASNIESLIDPIKIAEIMVQYENLQNYIDSVSLMELRGENFEHAEHKLTSTLRMLKYFVIEDPCVKHSLRFKLFLETNYENDGFGAGDKKKFTNSAYIMFFLRQNLHVNVHYINIDTTSYYYVTDHNYPNEFFMDLLFVLENNGNVEKFVIKDKDKFSVNHVNKIINALASATITKLVLRTKFDDESFYAINNFMKDNDKIKTFGICKDYVESDNRLIYLENCVSIQKLTLSCIIDDNLFEHMIKMLDNNQITKLDLSGSPLLAKFIQPLCGAIANNVRLVSLNLTGTKIHQMNDVLHLLTNKFLQCVNLSHNPICNNRHALLFAAQGNDSLRTFKIMSRGSFNDERPTLELLCDILNKNTNLETFCADMIRPQINKTIADAIMLAIDNNWTMKKLNILDNCAVFYNSTCPNFAAIKIKIHETMGRNCLLQSQQIKSARKI